MLKNYILIALRNLWKQKGYSLINISGLAIGLACCFLISIYIYNELSFDQFHEDKERLYRTVTSVERDENEQVYTTLTPPAFAVNWPVQFPEIEQIARYTQGSDMFIKYKNETLPRGNVSYAEDNFLTMFSFELLKGNPQSALLAPMSIVIPEKVAESHFPDGNPIGQTVELQGEHELTITGVLKDSPSNTHFKFDYLISLNSYPVTTADLYSEIPDVLNNYLVYNFATYLKLKEGANETGLENKIAIYETGSRDLPDNVSLNYDLQPITDIHFTSGIQFDTASGNIQYVIVFSAIAVLILVIAGFNFINLSTARAIKRAREVGLRKVLGGSRKLLVIQFLGESLMYVVLAFLLSLALLQALLPVFSYYISPDLAFSFFNHPGLLAALAGVTLTFGILAGSYPAIHLSSFQPVQALKLKITGSSTSLFRKILTISQFAMASFLLISTLIVYSQMQYMKNSDPGFQKEKVVYFSIHDLPTELRSQYEAFRQRLSQSSYVDQVSKSDELPGFVNSAYNFRINQGGQVKTQGIRSLIVDPHFIDLLDIKLLKGRNFSEEIQSDLNQAYIVNEAAVEEYGLSMEDTRLFALDGRPGEYGKIIGVVENFNYDGLQQDIEPLVLRMLDGYAFTVSARLAGGQIPDGVDHIEETWTEFFPGYPLSVQFLDETFESLYETEAKLSTLMGYFSGLTIFVACLGLIGLASFMAQQRTKEVGVRKVLGAGVERIIYLLNKDFVKVVLAGIIISIPIAWLVVQHWIQQFAYRIEIGPVYFLAAGLALLVISIVTVSYHSWRAARIDPVKSLKSE